MAKTEKIRAGDDKQKARPVSSILEADVRQKVEALITPVLAADAIELVLVEYRRESAGRVLRLYIDKPGGITLDDCVVVNRQIGDLLDISLEDVGPYRLEVSSPGLDRPLAKPLDFERFGNRRVQIRLKTPAEGRKILRGQLKGSDNDGITIETEAAVIRIRYEQIAMARLIPPTAP